MGEGASVKKKSTNIDGGSVVRCIYLVDIFKAALATSVAAAAHLSLSTCVFLCWTMRMPPALTENEKSIF